MVARVIRIRIRPHSPQEGVAKVAHERRAFRESQAIADHRPQHRHHGHQNKTLHHGAEDVLPSHQAAVKQCQPGTGHHQNQRGTDQHPRVIARHLRGLGGGFQRVQLRLEILGSLRQHGARQQSQKQAKVQCCVSHTLRQDCSRGNLPYFPTRRRRGQTETFLWTGLKISISPAAFPTSRKRW